MVKCLKEKCPIYFGFKYGDKIIYMCKVFPWEEIEDVCIGLPYIEPEIEKVACKISALSERFNTLSTLEDFILDNQDD